MNLTAWGYLGILDSGEDKVIKLQPQHGNSLRACCLHDSLGLSLVTKKAASGEGKSVATLFGSRQAMKQEYTKTLVINQITYPN